MSMSRCRPCLAPLLAAMCLGCAESDEPQRTAIPTWQVGSEPLVRIGGPDERPDYLVYRIAGLTRLSDGRIAVAAQSASQVKFFSPSGVHLRTTGREGRGPGEYGLILEMIRLPGDTLLVVSADPGLTWLSPDGDYLRSLPVAIWGRTRHPCRISDSKWHLLPDGSLATGFEDNPGIPGCPDAPDGTHRGTTMLERQDYSNSQFDTLAVLPGTERTGRWWRVFGASLLVAPGDDRLYAADATGAEIVGLTSDGSIAARMPMPFPAARIPASVKANAETVHTFDNGMREVETYDYPETYPRAARLLVDRVQNLWVMNYPQFQEPRYSWELDAGYLSRVESDGADWRVLDRNGQVIAGVQTPPGFFLWEAGPDYLLGTIKDEYDVEEIRLYGLRRAGA